MIEPRTLGRVAEVEAGARRDAHDLKKGGIVLQSDEESPEVEGI